MYGLYSGRAGRGGAGRRGAGPSPAHGLRFGSGGVITSSVVKAAPVLRTAPLDGLEDSEEVVESVEPDRGLAGEAAEAAEAASGGVPEPRRAPTAPAPDPLRWPCSHTSSNIARTQAPLAPATSD